MTAREDDQPTPDDLQGFAWWNALSQAKRLFWLMQAGGAAAGASAAAAAWAAFKAANGPASADPGANDAPGPRVPVRDR